MTKKWLFSVFALALVAAVTLQIAPAPAMAHERNDAKTFNVVVAIDASRLALNNNDPANPANPIRGTTFTVTGKIFPGGNIPPGITSSDPTQLRSIWTCVCSGVFVWDASALSVGEGIV